MKTTNTDTKIESSQIKSEINHNLHLENLIQEAILKKSKAIHIEPHNDFIVIRLRIDGLLKEVHKADKRLIERIISEIEIKTNDSIKESQTPYSAQFSYEIGDSNLKVAASILPTIEGQKIFLGLNLLDDQILDFKKLGLWGKNLDKINRAIVQTKGLILLSGSDNSGKTTTFYSILDLINSSSINISTIEKKIDHKLKGVNQIKINSNRSSATTKALSILAQQDPNVIMIEELRGYKESHQALQMALSGTLIFGGLHAENAVSTIKRLQQMGLESYLLASGLRVIASQRLMRKLCLYCSESYQPTADEINSIFNSLKYLNINNISYLHNLEKQALKSGLNPDVRLATTESSINQLKRAKPGGCKKCHYSGYSGRTAIFEVIENGLSIEKLIVSQADSLVIESQALNDGYTPMEVDGFVKVLRGISSVDELLRVI